MTLAIWSFLLVVLGPKQETTVVIGSKLHTESHILGEMLAQLIESETDLRVVRKFRLGGTLLIYQALLEGDIDMYPEYPGTIEQVILKSGSLKWPDLVNQLGQQNLTSSKPLGFNNTYALAIDPFKAGQESLERISQLGAFPNLRWGLTHEFLNRDDGLPGLRNHYDLAGNHVVGMDKSLQYQAIERGEVELIDAYSTDGRLKKYRLRLLQDDRGYFPAYLAVWLARRQTLERFPQLVTILEKFEDKLSNDAMQSLNAAVDLETKPVEIVAATGLATLTGKQATAPTIRSPWIDIASHIWEHLLLTGIALFFCIVLGVPLGFVIFRYPALASPTLAVVGLIQTIPSLALLALMIPLLGIGFTPAVVALFLYGLLPIVRNTYAGIREIPGTLIEAARGIGLTDTQILRWVRLPMALRFILAGIRTSAVISVGTATLAAFIGAGGLGEYILTGLSLNDTNTILKGAIPAALLAVLVDGLLAFTEKALTPKGLSRK